MLVKNKSILSGKVTEMDLPITQAQYERFMSGEHAQHVFPHLSPAEREFLVSGISPQEWNETFGEKQVQCADKTVEQVIEELSQLPSTMYVCLIHWNGNEYVRTIAQHLTELQHLKGENLF